MNDTRRLWLVVLAAAWVLAFGYAFVAWWTTVPDGSGFTRGANRVLAFLGWQGVAGMLALGLYGVGRAWPKGSSTRRLAAIPLGIAVLEVAAILGVIVWARYG